MGLFKTLDRHADLVNRMSDAVHADLADALIHDRMSAHELRNAVLNCTGCEAADACEHWLEDHKAGAADTPGYCRNRDMLLRVRG